VTIVVDINGNGTGWYLDAAPLDDDEFNDSEADLGYDLLTVLMHELGHSAGFHGEVTHVDHDGDLMSHDLRPGERHRPSTMDVEILRDLLSGAGEPADAFADAVDLALEDWG
jgi:hypothetical protein